MQDLSTRGLRVLTGQGAQIDTTTAGRLVFGIFAALAEFERELIRERTLAGLTAALGLIRSRGHVPKGGYDVPNGSTHTSAVPPAIQ